MADEKQKSALVRRHEQLKRWEESETNKAAVTAKDKDRKVNFQDGCVFLAACSAGDTPEVRALLDKGGNPNTTNVDGLTALHQACIDDNIEMVKFLLAHGADINARDNEGWTPLHATASCGYLDVAKCLIDNGADIACTNSDGDLPIDIAEGEDMEVLIAGEMEKQNIDADAARSDEESRMLVDANNWLQNKSIQEERHGRSGATALHVAAAKGYMKVMPVLLQAGADINARDFDGWTPIHAAAHWGQEDACKLLVDHMCDMEAKTNADLSIFDVADEEIRKLLEELKEKQLSIRNREKKGGLDEDAISALSKQHLPYKRRSSVNRLNSEEKHNIVAHVAVEEGVILTSACDDNHISASNQDSEDDDEPAEKKAMADAEASADKSQESANTNAKDGLGRPKLDSLGSIQSRLSKTDESSNSLGDSMVAEDSIYRSTSSAAAGKADSSAKAGLSSGTGIPGIQQQDSKSESSRRNSSLSAANQENLSVAAPSSTVVTGGVAIGTSKSTPSSAILPLDRNSAILPLDRTESKEDDDQFLDDAFGSFNGVYGSGGKHERVSRTGSLPSQLQVHDRRATQNASRSSATVPGPNAPIQQRIESTITPDSWRAGLRKTGSSSTVTDVSTSAYTPRGTSTQPLSDSVGVGDKLVQRSASSSVLQGGAASTELGTSSSSSAVPSQITLRQRPISYMSALGTGVPTAAAVDQRHSLTDRLPAPTSATPSAYIPYYRRKQIERETKEKEERERLSHQESGSESSSLSQLPTVAEVSPSAQDRRSSRFELPKRDEETETIRKLRAKRARETRRSTQGVTQEDVKAAEATLKSADKNAVSLSVPSATAGEVETRLNAKDPLPSPTAAAVLQLPGQKDSTSAAPDEDSKTEDDLRRRPWQRDDPGRSSFRKARDIISSSTTPASAAPEPTTRGVAVVTSDDDKDKDDDEKNGGRRSAALRTRRNRRERRSTGISYNEEGQEKKAEEKEGTVENTDDYKASSSRYDSRRLGSASDAPAVMGTATPASAGSATSSSAAGSSLLQRGDRSSYRQYLRNATGATDSGGSSVPAAAEDFKKLYDDMKQENEKLKKDVQKLEQDVVETRAELEKARQRNDSRVIDSGLEKRERRALERRISELEEELKNVGALKQENDGLKQDNQRLKEENGALIRVISKLSK